MPRADGIKQINLVDKDLPRNSSGDVCFTDVEQVQEFFTSEEIATLCNRAIYQAEYQRDHHKKYTQKIRDLEKPVKAKAKVMFPGIAWINLTEDQVNQAVEAVAQDLKKKKGQ